MFGGVVNSYEQSQFYSSSGRYRQQGQQQQAGYVAAQSVGYNPQDGGGGGCQDSNSGSSWENGWVNPCHGFDNQGSSSSTGLDGQSDYRELLGGKPGMDRRRAATRIIQIKVGRLTKDRCSKNGPE